MLFNGEWGVLGCRGRVRPRWIPFGGKEGNYGADAEVFTFVWEVGTRELCRANLNQF